MFRWRQALRCGFPSAIVVMVIAWTIGCRDRSSADRETATPRSESPEIEVSGDAPMSIHLVSSAFSDGEMIPREYTDDGTDKSPPLEWSNIPSEAKSLALICDDPDAPTPQPWVHWLIYDIPPQTSGLPAGIERSELPSLPAGAAQGQNSWSQGDTIGYRGPAPPAGRGLHHYHFRIYALDEPLRLGPGADVDALRQAMHGHVVATGQLTGVYER